MLRRRDDRGTNTLEFALVILPLLLLIFGGVQFGYLFWSLQTGKANARELARNLAVGNDQTACTTRAVNQADLPALGPVTTTVVYRDASTPAQVVASPVLGGTVTVTLQLQSLNVLPLVPMPSNGVVTQSYTEPVSDLQPDPTAC